MLTVEPYSLNFYWSKEKEKGLDTLASVFWYMKHDPAENPQKEMRAGGETDWKSGNRMLLKREKVRERAKNTQLANKTKTLFCEVFFTSS